MRQLSFRSNRKGVGINLLQVSSSLARVPARFTEKVPAAVVLGCVVMHGKERMGGN